MQDKFVACKMYIGLGSVFPGTILSFKIIFYYFLVAILILDQDTFMDGQNRFNQDKYVEILWNNIIQTR